MASKAASTYDLSRPPLYMALNAAWALESVAQRTWKAAAETSTRKPTAELVHKGRNCRSEDWGLKSAAHMAPKYASSSTTTAYLRARGLKGRLRIWQSEIQRPIICWPEAVAERLEGITRDKVGTKNS
ncbi:MAG: hypothetical protein FRX48_09736 [Lasallia pustulata]|uniref:Uncharacterized protein n=1 Tax=Lasallia pustulata TaxID=136370 RepID=A0A5M8PB65_9LECA|nr:MAG: hypothetical protein FRX48_09736 [Lasallia pustulata]